MSLFLMQQRSKSYRGSLERFGRGSEGRFRLSSLQRVHIGGRAGGKSEQAGIGLKPKVFKRKIK